MNAVVRLVPPGYHSAVPAAAALVVAALVCTLAAAQMLRAQGADAWRRRLESASVPLLAATALVVAARLAPQVGR